MNNNVYAIFSDEYVGDNESHIELIGIFDTLETAQAVLNEEGYLFRTQYDNVWQYEREWGCNATIVEVPLNTLSNSIRHSSEAWWNCNSV